MKDLSYLKKVVLEEVPANVPGTRTGTSSIVKQPTDADLRVFKNGRVYPSAAFLEANGFEYKAKIETVDPVTGNVKVTVIGNGLDIFSSTNWTMVKGLEEEVIFCAIIPRQGNPKIDLWGSCQYKEGLPVGTLLDQGASTFGKTSLVDMLASAYGVDWSTAKHVDLKVELDIPMVSESGVYHLPKLVARGEKKGKATYVRRELINIFPLTVVATETSEDTNPDITNALDTPVDDTQKIFAEGPATTANTTEPVDVTEMIKEKAKGSDLDLMEGSLKDEEAPADVSAKDDLLAS